MSSASAEACEVVVRTRPEEALEACRLGFTAAWESRPELTVRQAAALQSSLEWFSLFLENWLHSPHSGHLHDVTPFDYFDLRVMIRVGHNPAWGAMALERFRALVTELDNGVLVFDRAGCFFDEVAMAAALDYAKLDWDADDEEFEGLPRVHSSEVVGDVGGIGEEGSGEEEFVLADDDWDAVEGYFDDSARFLSWQTRCSRATYRCPGSWTRFR